MSEESLYRDIELIMRTLNVVAEDHAELLARVVRIEKLMDIEPVRNVCGAKSRFGHLCSRGIDHPGRHETGEFSWSGLDW